MGAGPSRWLEFGGAVDGFDAVARSFVLAELLEELKLGVGDGAGVAGGDLGFGAGVLGGALGFGGEEVAIALGVFVTGADGVAYAGDSAPGDALDLRTGSSSRRSASSRAASMAGVPARRVRARGDTCGGGFAQRGGGVEECGRIRNRAGPRAGAGGLRSG